MTSNRVGVEKFEESCYEKSPIAQVGGVGQMISQVSQYTSPVMLLNTKQGKSSSLMEDTPVSKKDFVSLRDIYDLLSIF